MKSANNEIPINYTKEAFLQPLNLGILLVATILGFAAGGLELATNLILTLVCAVELLYLGIVPRLPRFRKIIKLRKLSERSSEIEEKDIFKGLNENSKRKYLVMRHLVKLIKSNFDSLPHGSRGLLDTIRKKVDKLLSNYLTLLDLYKRYQIYMGTSVESRLRQEVEQEEKLIDKVELEKLQKTKARRVNILKKRLKKFGRAREKYLICETHLETIEDVIRYIYEQSMTMNNPEETGSQLDNLLIEMDETSSIIDRLGQESFITQYDIDEETLDYELMKAEENNQMQAAQERVKE